MDEQMQDLAQAMEIQLQFEEENQETPEPVIEGELVEPEE
jgi:hypothetical protein